MRTRCCILATLALIALVPSACHNSPGKTITLSMGNMIVTATATKPSNPELLITYGSGRTAAFGAYMATSGEGFQILTVDGWLDMEETTKLEIERIDGADRIRFWDSTGLQADLESSIITADSEFKSNYGSSDYFGTDSVTGMHEFEIYLMYKDSIHTVFVQAKG